MKKNITRRNVLQGSAALALGLSSTRVLAAAPPASAITPDLIAAAKKEGKVVYYTSIDCRWRRRLPRRLRRSFRDSA
jgi:iron(III) transport system substrate-binding protein